MTADGDDRVVLWSATDTEPDANSAFARFRSFAESRCGTEFPDYRAVHAWSVADPEHFWEAVRRFFEIGTPSDGRILDGEMPATRWFAGATANFAAQALSVGADNDCALVVVSDDLSSDTYSRARLRSEVAALAGALRAWGVESGDVIAGYLPNSAEAIVGLLAAASIGAVWSSVGQDYAASAVVTRMAQLEPVVLVSADGYTFAGTRHDRVAAIREIEASLPSLRRIVVSARLGAEPERGSDLWIGWKDALQCAGPVAPEPVPFDHPLWALFSSGTTGTPKALVHGHGGICLEMHTMLELNMDIGPADRFFWYTSPSWMMWNVLAASLVTGCSAVCYEGSADPAKVWSLVAREEATFFGTSPGFLRATADAGIEPARDHDLHALSSMGSTGSPLPASLHRWTRDAIGVPVHSSSGGTDIAGAFLAGAPGVPVWAGELSAPALGVAVSAWGHDGTPVTTGDVGELVVTRPLPSMPLRLWDDHDGSRYRASYFDAWPTVWRHGDWVSFTPDGSARLHGRSDATLNRRGVRMGSGDIYAVIEALPEVGEALVVGVEETDGEYWMPMFVTMAEGHVLDDAMRTKLCERIRRDVSPRHVPDDVIEVAALPHTRTGKKPEVPVKRILQGAEVSAVLALDAVDRADILDVFSSLAASRRSRTSGQVSTSQAKGALL